MVSDELNRLSLYLWQCLLLKLFFFYCQCGSVSVLLVRICLKPLLGVGDMCKYGERHVSVHRTELIILLWTFLWRCIGLSCFES